MSALIFERLPIFANADRRDNGDEFRLNQGVEHIDLNIDRTAYMTNIDPLVHWHLRRSMRWSLAFFLLGSNYRLARHTNRSSSVGVNERDDFWIDEPPQHHLHDVHGGGVGHAHAVDETLDSMLRRGQQLADLRAAAVDDNRVNAHELHQHHIGGKTVLQGRLGHSVAAVLDDHGGAMKAADVGQSTQSVPGSSCCLLGSVISLSVLLGVCWWTDWIYRNANELSTFL